MVHWMVYKDGRPQHVNGECYLHMLKKVWVEVKSKHGRGDTGGNRMAQFATPLTPPSSSWMTSSRGVAPIHPQPQPFRPLYVGVCHVPSPPDQASDHRPSPGDSWGCHCHDPGTDILGSSGKFDQEMRGLFASLWRPLEYGEQLKAKSEVVCNILICCRALHVP